jgi:acyl-CoA synthetase (AMP-forming)/AMP-acid ligase II
MDGTGLQLQSDPARLTIGRFLEDVAERHGDRLALRFEGRDRSYAELAAESRRLARALLAAGVAKGTRVAALFGNRPEFVQAYFAAGLVGAVLVPVNTFAAPDELDYVLRHGDASVLLLQPALLKQRYLDGLVERHPELARGAPGRPGCPALPLLRLVACLDLDAGRGVVEGWDAFLARADGVPDAVLDAAAREVHPADDGLVIYTSGTTARPKGVIHLQRAAAIQSWRFAELLGIGPDDRVWTAQPFFWTAGIAMSLGATLAAGASLHLSESFDPGAALACFEAERITTVHAWPHQEKALAEHPDAARRDLGSVRKLRASSPLAKLAGIEKDDWGPDAAYGLSETFTIVTALPADAPAERRRACHGAVLPGNVVRILDPESGREVPRGEAGEIAVRGPTLMRGYAKVEPELVFDAEGFFRTQDGGWLDESGELHWTGRLSNLVKTGGANVSPVEVESALASHPDLRAALAVGVPHPTLGEALVLCAIPRDGARVDEAALRGFLAGRLAAYKVPRRVLFFGAEELAYTGSQKIQLGPLREAALRRLAREGAEIAGHRYAADRS